MNYEEKRQYPREVYECPMNMYRMDLQDDRFFAQMHDFSRGGLSMKTNEKLVIGQLVYLEMVNHDNLTDGPEKQKGYTGTVKWERPDPISDNTGRYQYGVEYLEPVH